MMKAAHPEVVAATRVNPGETLRQARESRGWSLAEVAVKLNLTVTSLSNLEAGAFDKLPGHTFARGYIRAYAKLLGTDQAPLVQAFDQATGSHSQGSDVHSLGRIEEPVRLSHNILRGVSLVLLLAVVGGGFFWWQDQNSQRNKDQSGLAMEHVEVESADGTTQIHPIDEPEEPAATVAEKAGTTSTPLSLGQGQPPVDPATTGTPASLASAPAPAVVPVATPAPVVSAPVVPSTPVVAHAPALTPAVSVAPTTTDTAPVVGAGQLHIQFTAACWTQVSDANGKVLFSGLKRKGESLALGGKPPFAVRLGYARGAQITFNGQPVDVAPFTSGETARMKVGQ
jgi:cytoskeleton protein RodZ